MLAPLIIFTYRRDIDKTINSLLQNKLSKESNLIIFSDGWKNEKDKQDVLSLRESLKNIKGFRKIEIIEREKNYGLAKNIIVGVSEVINEYGRVIVLEDDLIVSNDFLEYMNEALDYYEKDEKIWSISGYTPNLECLKNYDKDVYLSVRGSSWGWATWKDRWNSIDWDIKDWNEFKKDKEAIKRFNLGGNDMFKMLELQVLGKIDSWAIVWCYNQFKQKKYTIYPKYSKIKNVGFDRKGTHSFIGFKKWHVEIFEEKLRLEDVEIDDYILRSFKSFYDMNLRSKIGYFLRKHGGYHFIKEIISIMRII